MVTPLGGGGGGALGISRWQWAAGTLEPLRPVQTLATLLGPTCCERLHTMLCVVAFCWKLLDEVWPVSNFIQQLPTSRNNTQHGVQMLATCCVLLANNVASVCTGLNNCTSTFWDFYFNRIANLWNSIPNDVRQAESIDSFKRELFYFNGLFNVFDDDNFRTFKIICPKCHRVNTLTACTC